MYFQHIVIWKKKFHASVFFIWTECYKTNWSSSKNQYLISDKGAKKGYLNDRLQLMTQLINKENLLQTVTCHKGCQLMLNLYHAFIEKECDIDEFNVM